MTITAWTKWPEGPSLDPHEIQTLYGWHCVGEPGAWDIPKLSTDLSELLVHSHWNGQLPAPPASTRLCRHLVFATEPEIFVGYTAYNATYGLLRVWARCPAKADAEFARLRVAYFREIPEHDTLTEFLVLTARNGDLDLRTISVPRRLQSADDLRLHYGDDFLGWHDGLIRELNVRRHGLTILRGPPGTGKTTYLRHLLYQLRKTHRFYYVPLPVYPAISSPSFVDLWISENETHKALTKVVLLEDAEAILAERDDENQESLSTLLNIGDGFLGDFLQMHVICTMNAPIARLDPAVKRTGRLIAARQFNRLTWPQAHRLAEARGITLEVRDSYSLAEIYASSCLADDLTQDHESKIGFAA